LLANVLLDEVDKLLEKQGQCFARYADDTFMSAVGKPASG
jgi:hypothetical protein